MGGSEPPLLLVTNDDGIFEPGIAALVKSLEPLGEVWVVAPDRDCSGMSHTISLMKPLRAIELRPRRFQVDGSPADCVYLGVHELCPRKPDLVLSGVNAGPNLSFDVHYSGTVGAAVEATLLGVPGIAVSLTEPSPSGFAHSADFAGRLAAQCLREALPTNTVLNVNVPGGVPGAFQLTFLGHRLFRHSVHRRDDPRGRPYYWIGGVPERPADLPGSDCNAVSEGHISVTPLSIDMTHLRALTTHLADLQVEGSASVPRVDPPGELELIPPQ